MVIQGYAFGDHWKADEELHTPYNNVGLSLVSKAIPTKTLKIALSTSRLSFDAPPQKPP